ncbi:hypothetical protein [Photobacterium leiognathi]|uniref:hypothetical protein n=1 Tax=Photobacterium leiognathi TaxID=553611 RepID=UPI0029824734|nr:hypothetical protein [Photobacterium leiognathi]
MKNTLRLIINRLIPKFRICNALVTSGLAIIVATNTTPWKILFSFISESGKIIAQTPDNNPLYPNIIGLFLVLIGITIYYSEKSKKNCNLDELYGENPPLKKQEDFYNRYGIKAPVDLIDFILSHNNAKEVIEKYKDSNNSVDFQNGIFKAAFPLKRKKWGLIIILVLLFSSITTTCLIFASGNMKEAMSSLMLTLSFALVTYIFISDNKREYSQRWLVELTKVEK